MARIAFMNRLPLAYATVTHYNLPGGHASFDGHTSEDVALRAWLRRRVWEGPDRRDEWAVSIEMLTPEAAAQRLHPDWGPPVHSPCLMLLHDGRFWVDPGIEQRCAESFGRLARSMARGGIRRVESMAAPWGSPLLRVPAPVPAVPLPAARADDGPVHAEVDQGHEPDL